MTVAPSVMGPWLTATLLCLSSAGVWAAEPPANEKAAVETPAAAAPASSEEVEEGELSDDAEVSDELEEDFAPLTAADLNTILGVQVLAALDKPIVGLELRFGETWGPRFEASFVWTSRASDEIDGSFVGNQYSIGLEWTPLRTRFVDVHVGAAADVYHLWGIHGDLVEVAASLEANGVLWLTEELGASAGLRAYPLATEGLELGKTRGGATGSPLLLALAVRWRFR